MPPRAVDYSLVEVLIESASPATARLEPFEGREPPDGRNPSPQIRLDPSPESGPEEAVAGPPNGTLVWSAFPPPRAGTPSAAAAWPAPGPPHVVVRPVTAADRPD